MMKPCGGTIAEANDFFRQGGSALARITVGDSAVAAARTASTVTSSITTTSSMRFGASRWRRSAWSTATRFYRAMRTG